MTHKLAPEGAILATFGGYGVKPGEFLYPVAAAVAPDDSVSVLNAEAHLVQRFDNSGKYLSSSADGEMARAPSTSLETSAWGMMERSTSSATEIARFSDSAPTGAMRLGGLSEGPQIGSGCESLTDSLSIRPAISTFPK